MPFTVEICSLALSAMTNHVLRPLGGIVEIGICSMKFNNSVYFICIQHGTEIRRLRLRSFGFGPEVSQFTYGCQFGCIPPEFHPPEYANL